MADEETAALVSAGSGFPVMRAADGLPPDAASVSFSPDRAADVQWLRSARPGGNRVIAPVGDDLWRRAPWPAADDLFEWSVSSGRIAVVGGGDVLTGRLREAGANVEAVATLGPRELEAAAVVVFPGGAGDPLPAEGPAVLAAGRILVTTPRSPDFGFRPAIDHCVGSRTGDLADLALSAVRHPRGFEAMRVYGRLAAERHRASRVLSELAIDLELGL